MTDRWKNILIGIFITAALGIGVFLVLFLKPTMGDGKQTLKVRFSNIAGLHKGTRVTYAGRPVGQVVKIEEVSNARQNPDPENGKVYYYQLVLRIDSGTCVYTSDDISICTSGLMGERSIAILPKAPIPGQNLQRVTNQVLVANSVDVLESTFNQMGKVAAKAEKSIDRFDQWFEQNANTLSDATKNFSQAAQSLNTVLTTVDQQNLVPALKESVELVSDNMRYVKDALDNDHLLSRLSSLISDFNESILVFNTDGAKTIANINQITHELSEGSGTLGRILVGDDFYLRLNSLMSKSETLMNDINHYGLLFQYNKQWQKNRTRKANLANALESPKEFRDYFEKEIDEIGASLGRIAELLDRADQDQERDKILQNTGFQKDFAVLLRQVKALNDSIRLFNQDLTAKLDNH